MKNIPFQIEDAVEIKTSKVQGVVTGLYITKGSVKYEVSFFLNGEHMTGLFDDFMLEKERVKRKVGMV